MIYEPREDSFLLEKWVKKLAKNKSVLDMGSGSGIQAQAALNSNALSVTAVDVDEESIAHLKRKFKAEKKIKVIKSNLFSKVDGKYDLIVFNPPYLPEDKREDKYVKNVTTGGKKGDEIFLRFLKQAKSHMDKDSQILLIVSSLTPQDKIEKLLKKLKLHNKVLDKKSFFMERLELWALSGS